MTALAFASSWARRRGPSTLLLGGALAAGAACAASAYLVSPVLFPVVMAVIGIGAASLTRPEVGIAAAMCVGSTGYLAVGERVAGVLLIGAAGLLCLLPALEKTPPGGGQRPARGLALAGTAYALAALVATAGAQDLSVAVHALRLLAGGMLLAYAIATLVRRRAQVRWVLGASAFAAAAIGGYATFQQVTGANTGIGFLTSSGTVISRVTAGFVHPNLLGGFLVVLVPLCLGAAILERRGRLLFLAAAGLASLGLYASFSRGALIGLACSSLLFVRGRRLMLLVPLLVLMLGLTAPKLLTERFANVTEHGGDVSSRVDIWRTAEEIWLQHPIAGVGLGNFPQAYAATRIPGKEFLPGLDLQPPPHAHNIFLELLAEEGVLGFLALIALLSWGARGALRLRGSPDRWASTMGTTCLAALVGFVLHNLFDYTLIDSATTLFLWAVLALISAATAIVGREAGAPCPTTASGEPTAAGPVAALEAR